MKFKKIISLLTTMMVAAAPICSTSYVNATGSQTYLLGDINGNGVVDVTDLPLMMQFLRGSLSADGCAAERLDVNRDYTIDSDDLNMLISIVFGDEPTGSVNSENIEDLPPSEDRQYNIYNPNGSFVRYYVLTGLSEIQTDSTRGIIPPDDRTPENNLKSVIKVNKDGANFGTAFIIDNHTIMTAAHVLYNNDDNHNNNDCGVNTGLSFKIYNDYNTPSNDIITPTAYHIPRKYIYDPYNPNEERWRYDYAIVTVAEDLTRYIGDLEFTLGVMREGFPGTDAIATNEERKLYVTGFGGSNTNIQANINVKTTGEGYLLSNTYGHSSYYWNYALYYNVDAVAGDSGGPLYVLDSNGNKIVVGINAYGYDDVFNQATRVTPDILHFVYNNPKLTE